MSKVIKHVKPARKRLVVRNPNNGLQPIPEEGKNVEWTPEWARKQRDGDIIVSPAKTTVSKKKQSTGGGS